MGTGCSPRTTSPGRSLSGLGLALADPWGVEPCMPREQFSGLPRAWLPPAPSRGENESPGFFPSGWGSCFG